MECKAQEQGTQMYIKSKIGNHFIDSQLDGKLLQRKIGKFLNYQDPNGSWGPTDVNIQNVHIPDIKSSLEILKPGFNNSRLEASHYCCETNAIRSYFGNIDNKEDYSVIMTFALSNDPSVWIRFIGIGTDANIIQNSTSGCRWENAWKDVDIELDITRGEIKENIFIKSKQAPKKFIFAVQCASGISMAVKNNIAIFYDLTGKDIFKTSPPWGIDSLSKNIKAKLVQGDFVDLNNIRCPTIVLAPDAIDMEDAEYPVKIDPTTTISGAAAIEDDGLVSWSGNSNAGKAVSISIGQGGMYKALVRLDKTLIPAGTIVGFYLNMYNILVQYGNYNDYFYRIKAANDWTEGMGTGWSTPALAGEPCYLWCKYNTQAWAGSAGLNTSGTDFDADADPPVIFIESGGWYAAALRTFWATDWRDNVVTNNGFIITNPNASGSGPYYHTAENTSYPSYFTVDYLGDLSGLNRVGVGYEPAGFNHTNGVISNIKIYKRPTRK